MSATRARFGRDRRILKGAEFQTILQQGRRISAPLLNLAMIPASGRGRIGISASTRVGGSVQRNRARRLVREFYRQTYRRSAPYDLVVTLKPGFAELSADESRRALEDALARPIPGRKGSGRRPDPWR